MPKQAEPVDDLAATIRRRPYFVLRDNCLTKSVEFARRCSDMGLEAKVVVCLALSHKRVPLTHLMVPVVHPHFYAEVLGRQYEVSHESGGEKQSEPRVLVRLRRFQLPFSKSSQGKLRENRK